MNHEWDDDAGCIHCGHDGAEEFHLKRLGYTYPPSSCPVWDKGLRVRNRKRYAQDQEFDAVQGIAPGESPEEFDARMRREGIA